MRKRSVYLGLVKHFLKNVEIRISLLRREDVKSHVTDENVIYTARYYLEKS